MFKFLPYSLASGIKSHSKNEVGKVRSTSVIIARLYSFSKEEHP